VHRDLEARPVDGANRHRTWASSRTRFAGSNEGSGRGLVTAWSLPQLTPI
jgi:hypothetical protein